MSLGHGASVVRDGLVLHLDAANVKSYPGKTGPELVTNSVITSIDGNTFNVFRTSTTQQTLSLCSVTANKYYIVTYVISSYTGNVGATFRINGGGGNLTPGIGISSAGTFTRTFQATVSGSLSINGDNTGTDFEVDYVSVKEMTDNTGTTWHDLSGNGNNGVFTNSPTISSDGVTLSSSSYVVVSNTLGTSAATQVTYSFVMNFNWNSITGYRTIFGIYDNSFAQSASFVLNTSSTQLEYEIRSPVAVERDIFDKNMASYINTPVMITYTFNAGAHKLYLNGSLDSTYSGTNTSFPTWSNSLGLGIGENVQGGGSSRLLQSGTFNSLQVYNRALTANEVKQNFEALRGRYSI